jgi:putative flippase GtrA
MLLMWILVKKVIINDSASKVIVNIIVIVLNYVMSKYLIFKGEEL